MFGAHPFGSLPFGSNAQPALLDPIVINDILSETAPDLSSGPTLQLYKFVTSQGTLRLVSFEDPYSSTEGFVDFNGETYQTVHVTRTEIRRSTEGDYPLLDVQMQDSTRVLLTHAKQADISNSLCTLSIINYSDLSDPSKAQTINMRLASVSFDQKSNAVVATLGAPTLLRMRLPAIFMNRSKCFNPWANRFRHDRRNFCNHPSDEFQHFTKQRFEVDFVTADDAEHEMSFGWHRRNTASATSLVSMILQTNDHTVAGSDGRGVMRMDPMPKRASAAWSSPDDKWHIYKRIPSGSESDTDIDVYCSVRNAGIPSIDLLYAGIWIVQDSDESNFIFFGRKVVNASDQGTIVVVKGDGTVTETALSGHDTDDTLRVQRVGSAWKFYTASVVFYGNVIREPTWTYHSELDQTLSMSGDLRVGVTAEFEDTSVSFHSVDFGMFRFLAGGLQKCDRTLSACQVRNQTHSFNGFLGMPERHVIF